MKRISIRKSSIMRFFKLAIGVGRNIYKNKMKKYCPPLNPMSNFGSFGILIAENFLTPPR